MIQDWIKVKLCNKTSKPKLDQYIEIVKKKDTNQMLNTISDFDKLVKHLHSEVDKSKNSEYMPSFLKSDDWDSEEGKYDSEYKTDDESDIDKDEDYNIKFKEMIEDKKIFNDDTVKAKKAFRNFIEPFIKDSV